MPQVVSSLEALCQGACVLSCWYERHTLGSCVKSDHETLVAGW